MSETGYRVLVVGGEAQQRAELAAALRKAGCAVTAEASPRAAISHAEREDLDVVLTELHLDEMSGLELGRAIQERRPHLPIVVLAGEPSLADAIAAIRHGVVDFLIKPASTDDLMGAIRRAAMQHGLQRAQAPLPPNPLAHDFLVGRSAAIRRIYDLVSRIRGSDASVLICGESGTGKEGVARALHASSARASGPLVAVNCAAIPSALLESELFGHARGAFTDARSPRAGLFTTANGGTLILDEISEMPLDMQSKLLRSLQERTIRPVGSNDEVPFDARLITITNRNLETDVELGRFRKDLYYRINVVKIDLPPLRERGDDLLLLANHFVERFAERSHKPTLRLSLPAAERLARYDWPGNVRELENCIERGVAMARFDQISVEDLPEHIRLHHPQAPLHDHAHEGPIVPLLEIERRYVRHVLRLANGNKSRAAQLLGVDRRTLYRMLERG